MTWDVEYTDEFGVWWQDLDESEQESIAHTVGLLEALGQSWLRNAVLLIGGNKTGDDRWYDRFVPIADRLYDVHLVALIKEGLWNGKKIRGPET